MARPHSKTDRRPKADRRRAGMTVAEVSIVSAIVAAMVGFALPMAGEWIGSQRLFSSAQRIEGALTYARGEAIRTGRMHIVFFGADADGNALEDGEGNAVGVLVIDDGRPGDTGQNCKVDDGEEVFGFAFEEAVSFGVTDATRTAPNDGGNGGALEAGVTFRDAGGNPARWVLFLPDGVPAAFSADCSLGGIGSGAGGIYLTSGDRDASAILSPLGLSRSHTWSRASGAWSN